MSANQVLWTIQPLDVWEQLRSQGVVLVDPSRIQDRYINPQYRWLTGRIARRLSDWEGLMPWWFYCQRPDLRTHRHLQRDYQVLIEVLPPLGSFQSFPVWAWHEIFCWNYVSLTREEERQWQRRVAQVTELPEGDAGWSDYTRELRREARQSWERLFDPNLPARSWRRGQTSITREAVMESIRMDWVQSTKVFKGVQLPRQDSNLGIIDTTQAPNKLE